MGSKCSGHLSWVGHPNTAKPPSICEPQQEPRPVGWVWDWAGLRVGQLDQLIVPYWNMLKARVAAVHSPVRGRCAHGARRWCQPAVVRFQSICRSACLLGAEPRARRGWSAMVGGTHCVGRGRLTCHADLRRHALRHHANTLPHASAANPPSPLSRHCRRGCCACCRARACSGRPAACTAASWPR